jgi:post-segregation antitoxin (ccd killing protein)
LCGASENRPGTRTRPANRTTFRAHAIGNRSKGNDDPWRNYPTRSDTAAHLARKSTIERGAEHGLHTDFDPDTYPRETDALTRLTHVRSTRMVYIHVHVCSARMTERKQKLTLSVETGIVEQAKRLGVNISEVTEQVLRGYAVKDEGLDWKSYKDQYLAFLHTMDPLLSKYRASVVVGDLFARPGEKDKSFEGEIRYYAGGRFSTDMIEDILTLDEIESPGYSVGLRNPGHVLQNFVRELEAAKIRRKEEIANLLIASRIVNAIYKADSKSGAPRSKKSRIAAAVGKTKPGKG